MNKRKRCTYCGQHGVIFDGLCVRCGRINTPFDFWMARWGRLISWAIITSVSMLALGVLIGELIHGKS